jgi:hypothetical protein
MFRFSEILSETESFGGVYRVLCFVVSRALGQAETDEEGRSPPDDDAAGAGRPRLIDPPLFPKRRAVWLALSPGLRKFSAKKPSVWKRQPRIQHARLL